MTAQHRGVNSAAARPPAPGDLIFRPRPRSGAEIRLFLAHHAGGGGNAYRGWADALPETIELALIVLPGRERLRKRPFVRDFTHAVELATEQIRGYLDCPFAVFGHSLGAHLAYRMLTHLDDDERRLLRHFLPSGNHGPSWFLGGGMPRWSALPDAEFVTAFIAEGGLPPRVAATPGFLDMLLPMFRADQELSESIGAMPGVPRLHCPVTAVGGREDRYGAEAMESWREIAAGPFSVKLFPGGHFYFENCLPDVMDLIVKCLAV